ncbi:unnamed protein product [Coregonus sp. 'balchen']|nr:unnamed protein product [Coregonus sp. 'balchen']
MTGVFVQLMGVAPGPAVSWRKECQPFPDNYVDCRFMEELRRNEGLRQYRYWAVVREAGLVAQQISCGLLSSSTLLWSGLLCALLGYGLYQTLAPRENSDSHQCTRWSDLQSASIFLSFTFGFSPVLRTLRVHTVYAMTALLLLAHLVAFPYTQPTPPGSLFQRCPVHLSLPGLSPPHLLGPGLLSLHTFSMLCWTLLVFTLWPCLLQQLREHAPRGFGWGAGCSVGRLTLQLIRLQSDKDNIQGPWDEAEIREDLTCFLH